MLDDYIFMYGGRQWLLALILLKSQKEPNSL